MDSIKAQKLKAMKNYKKAQFVYNLVVYSLTAFLSVLFYLYLFCFPLMRQFLFDFLPNIYSFFLNPKFLFVLGNIIVIILVGESKLAASSRSSLATEIYDEYVERSRSLRLQSAVVECKKKEGNLEMDKNEKSSIRRHCSLSHIRCLEVKKKEMAGRSLRRPRSVVEHNKDGRLLEMHEAEKTIVATREDDLYNIRSLEEKRSMSLGRLDVQYENGKTTMATGGDDIRNIRSLEGKRKAIVGQGHGLTRPMSLGRLDKIYENGKTTMATRGDDIRNIRSLEGKKKVTVGQGHGLTGPMSLGRLDMQYENGKTTVVAQGDDIYNIRSLKGKKRATVGQGQGLTKPMSLGTLHMQNQNENEMTTTASAGGDDHFYNIKFPEERRQETVNQGLTRPQSLGRLDMHENEKGSDDDVNKMSLEEKRKEMEQSMDDLYRRVEEFIARVNKQRMLEARELDSSL